MLAFIPLAMTMAKEPIFNESERTFAKAFLRGIKHYIKARVGRLVQLYSMSRQKAFETVKKRLRRINMDFLAPIDNWQFLNQEVITIL